MTLVRLVVVPCPPVVEVLIKRPDTKYQLGFSVQDGIVSEGNIPFKNVKIYLITKPFFSLNRFVVCSGVESLNVVVFVLAIES